MPKIASLNISRLQVAGAATAAGIAATALIGGWEGKENQAYRDIVGVWTICYGETKGVKPGMSRTDAECTEMLQHSIVKHEQGMRKCLKNPDAIPEKSYVAFVSFTYNLGVGAFCNSTIRKRTDAGDLRGACEAIRWYNRAGGKVVRGLTLRRQDEYRLCMEGIR